MSESKISRGRYLLVWCDSNKQDHYEAHWDYGEALRRYREVIDNDAYSANIAETIKSTDYSVQEKEETQGWGDSRVATKYVFGRIGNALNSADLDEMSQELSNLYSELAHNYKVDTGKLIGADNE